MLFSTYSQARRGYVPVVTFLVLVIMSMVGVGAVQVTNKVNHIAVTGLLAVLAEIVHPGLASLESACISQKHFLMAYNGAVKISAVDQLFSLFTWKRVVAR